MLLSSDAQELAMLKSWGRNVANLAKPRMVGDSARLNLERRSPPLPSNRTPGPAKGLPCRVRSEGDPNIG